jgi:cardiolipin synthase
MGSALSAALTNRRQLGPAEAGLLLRMGILVILVAVVAAIWPAVVAWPLAFILAWFGLTWLAKSAQLRRRGNRAPRTAPKAAAMPPEARARE